MAHAGMDIARINFSHGDPREHQAVIRAVREVNKKFHRKINILQDLQGYRIRLGLLKAPMELKKGARVWLTLGRRQKGNALVLDADFDLKLLRPGMDIFISDGMIALKVIKFLGDRVQVKVLQGGVVSSKKGVNIPALKLKANILTEKDRRDIEFGIHENVDFIAQSFVRNPEDILEVVRIVKPRLARCRIIAKIENKEGVDHLQGILKACDGIMIARGDLGVSLPIYQVPMIQKEIIRQCNAAGKMDITATQMLESMTEHLRPTRAEVSDVANAILDGSDCVMLSGETAVGRFPVETVEMMAQIINFTEKTARPITRPKY
jgi:pyruvate kinase